ncbi:MAG: hypothetical protein HW403_931 [Dehalococcoidia bacterium]|nr:hypothetical protein [Dehalococcoidia bacterium]
MHKMSNKFFYGGQAVIEGVMMRGPGHYSVAVRRPDGQIAVKVTPLPSYTFRPFRRWFLVRGVMTLWEALSIGMSALYYSAAVSQGEEEAPLTRGEMAMVFGGAGVIGIGVFFLGPTLATEWLHSFIPSSIIVNLAEGLLRLGLLVGYIGLIGRMADVKRLFAYHGAEHKTIWAYEHGVELVPSEIQRFPTAHPRCGTAFLLTVGVVAIFLFALTGQPPLWLRLLSRLVLLPVVAAVSYEIIRFSGTHSNNPLSRLLAAPGLALQAMTTRQPDDDQVEVAVTAFQSLRAAEAEAEARVT